MTPNFKVEDLALFDIQYIFMNMRARSVEEQISMNVVCPDDGETELSITITIDDIKVNFLRVIRRKLNWMITLCL